MKNILYCFSLVLHEKNLFVYLDVSIIYLKVINNLTGGQWI